MKNAPIILGLVLCAGAALLPGGTVMAQVIRMSETRCVVDGLVQLRDERVHTITPLAGATVHLASADDSLRTVVADSTGCFAATVSVGGRYELTVEYTGYFTARTHLNVADSGSRMPVVLSLNRIITIDCDFRRPPVYEFNQIKVPSVMAKRLDELAQQLLDHPNTYADLYAHADQHGSAAYNQWLSQQRAAAAVAYLVGLGIEPTHIKAQAFGETRPEIRAPRTAEDYQRNRRLEFVIRRLP